MPDFKAINEELIEKHSQEVYQGRMPAHNREAMRRMLEAEDRHWAKEAVREDSHSPVGDWNGMRTN